MLYIPITGPNERSPLVFFLEAHTLVIYCYMTLLYARIGSKHTFLLFLFMTIGEVFEIFDAFEYSVGKMLIFHCKQ